MIRIPETWTHTRRPCVICSKATLLAAKTLVDPIDTKQFVMSIRPDLLATDWSSVNEDDPLADKPEFDDAWQYMVLLVVHHNHQVIVKGWNDAVAFINPTHNITHWMWISNEMRDDGHLPSSYKKFLIPEKLEDFSGEEHPLVAYLIRVLAPDQLPKDDLGTDWKKGQKGIKQRVAMASQICYLVSINVFFKKLESTDIYIVIQLIFLLLCCFPINTAVDRESKHHRFYQKIFWESYQKPNRWLLFNPLCWLQLPPSWSPGNCVCPQVLATNPETGGMGLTEGFMSMVQKSYELNNFNWVKRFECYTQIDLLYTKSNLDQFYRALQGNVGHAYTTTHKPDTGGGGSSMQTPTALATTHQPYQSHSGGLGLEFVAGDAGAVERPPTFSDRAAMRAAIPDWWREVAGNFPTVPLELLNKGHVPSHN